MIVQKLRRKGVDNFEVAMMYFSLLSSLNSLALTERELQLLSFTAIKGNMTLGNVKEEFCRTFDTTFATIANIVYKLKKQHLLVKEEGKIKVNKILGLNFNDGITLNIILENGAEKKKEL